MNIKLLDPFVMMPATDHAYSHTPPSGWEIDSLGVLTQSARLDAGRIGGGRILRPEETPELAKLRFGLLSKLPLPVRTVLGIGFDHGHFLRLCAQYSLTPFSSYSMPGAEIESTDHFGGNVDLVVLFDSLTRFEDLTFLRDVVAKQVIVSVPWLPSFDEKALARWRHWLPGEHLRQFNPLSLRAFMDSLGFVELGHGCPEDVLRKGNGKQPNILTASFVSLDYR